MGKTIKKNSWQVGISKETYAKDSVARAYTNAVRGGFIWVKRKKCDVKADNDRLKQEYEMALVEWETKRSREIARCVDIGIRWTSEWAWTDLNPKPRLYRAPTIMKVSFDMTFNEFFEENLKEQVDYYDKIRRKGFNETTRKKWFKELCKKNIRRNNSNNVSKVMKGEDTEDMIWTKKRDTSFYKWVVW